MTGRALAALVAADVAARAVVAWWVRRGARRDSLCEEDATRAVADAVFAVGDEVADELRAVYARLGEVLDVLTDAGRRPG